MPQLNSGADQGLRWQIETLMGNRGPNDGRLGQRKPKKGQERVVMGPPSPPRGNRGEKVVVPPIILEPPAPVSAGNVAVGAMGFTMALESSGALGAMEITGGISAGLLADDVTGIGVADDVLIPVVVAIGLVAAAYLLASYALSESDGMEYDDPTRNPAQDKPLTQGEIDKLKGAGIDIHEDIKGVEGAGKIDLYKDRKGNIYIKAKGGKGPGEPTGYNINDY